MDELVVVGKGISKPGEEGLKQLRPEMAAQAGSPSPKLSNQPQVPKEGSPGFTEQLVFGEGSKVGEVKPSISVGVCAMEAKVWTWFVYIVGYVATCLCG